MVSVLLWLSFFSSAGTGVLLLKEEESIHSKIDAHRMCVGGCLCYQPNKNCGGLAGAVHSFSLSSIAASSCYYTLVTPGAGQRQCYIGLWAATSPP